MNTGIVKVDDNGQGYDRATSMAEFKALADEIYITDVTPPSDNPYLEPVNIPPYNSEDPSHLLITEGNGNWNSTNLNSAVYKHFYVEPGDYSSSIITLTRDGTENDRRSISLHDGLETHPASLSVAQQADIKIRFNDADYWDIHRMSGLSYQPETDVNWFYNGASYNTLNMYNLKDYYYGIRILHASNYNTIQKCYIDTMATAGRSSDNLAIALTPADQGEGTVIRGTKIIENDIRNAGDGIQLIRQPETSIGIDFPATTIDSNNIWIDSDIYTDGSGNYTPDGEYQHAEEAMDFKAGSTESANPVIVTNNRMWGFRNNDGSFGGSTSFFGGVAVVFHFGALNVKFNNNIIFDSLYSVSCTNEQAMPASMTGEINNNIFDSTGVPNPDSRTLYNIALQDASDLTFNNNTIVNDVNSKYMVAEQTLGPVRLNDNLFISCPNGIIKSGDTVVDSTYYYDTPTTLPGTNETDGGVASNANMTDYTFTYERYTTAPKSKTLTEVISTPSSPHYGVAGSDLT